MNKIFVIVLLQSLLSMWAVAQDKNITGVVSDASGTPLPGVTVHAHSSSTSVMTDLDGYYEISVPVATEKLTFNFLFYETQEVYIKNQNITQLDVILRTYELEEEPKYSEDAAGAIRDTDEDISLSYNIAQVSSLGITIWPTTHNKNIINVATQLGKFEKLEIHSLSGELLLETTDSKIDISTLENGYYLLRVVMGSNRVFSKKILKG